MIASAAVAVVWLAARKRLYKLREMTLGESPLLATQVLLPVLGNCLLMALPVAWLIHTPARLPSWMDDLAAPQGWIGLLLAAAAAAWYLRQTQPASLLHVLGGFAVGAGVLAACDAALIYRHAAADSWVAYHALTTAWAAAGLMVFVLAMAARTVGERKLLGPRSPTMSPWRPQPWVATIGTLTVVMATLHAFHDPARPWWAAGAILAVSLTAGLVAVLLRKPTHVYFSGLLINLAGTIVWWAYSSSIVRWPAVESGRHGRLGAGQCAVPGDRFRRVVARGSLAPGCAESRKPTGGSRLPIWLPRRALILLGLVTAIGVATTLLGQPMPIEPLDWIALAGVVTATAICLRDRRARLPAAYALWSRPVGHRLGALGTATRAADVLLVGGGRVGRLRPGHRGDRPVPAATYSSRSA